MRALGAFVFVSLILSSSLRGQETPRPEALPSPIPRIEKPMEVVVPAEWLEGDRLERRRLVDLESHRRPSPLEVDDWENSPPLNLGMLKGKVVVLFFWSTESDPSRAILPYLAEIYGRWKGKGVELVGICASAGAGRMKDTIGQYGIRFPVAADVEERTAAEYLVNGRPDFYVIDQEGFFYVVDAQNGAIESIIKKLLDDTK